MSRLLTAVVVLLVLALPASADTYTPVPTRLADAMRAAEIHWGGLPPCGKPTVSFHRAAWINAQVGFTGDPWAGPTGLAYPKRCHAALRRNLNVAGMFGHLCPAAVHEIGHLFDYGHSEDPDDVMAPNGGWGQTAACVRMVRERRARWG